MIAMVEQKKKTRIWVWEQNPSDFSVKRQNRQPTNRKMILIVLLIVWMMTLSHHGRMAANGFQREGLFFGGLMTCFLVWGILALFAGIIQCILYMVDERWSQDRLTLMRNLSVTTSRG